MLISKEEQGNEFSAPSKKKLLFFHTSMIVIKDKGQQQQKLLLSSLIISINFLNHLKHKPVEFEMYIFQNILKI